MNLTADLALPDERALLEAALDYRTPATSAADWNHAAAFLASVESPVRARIMAVADCIDDQDPGYVALGEILDELHVARQQRRMAGSS